MTQLPSQGLNGETPSLARVYNVFLGGCRNFESDRKLARSAIAAAPQIPAAARANRDFMRRAIDYAVTRGVTQFLDLGSGIPTLGAVHEIALDPSIRVVYVDHDPVAVAQGGTLLAGDPRTAMIEQDIRHLNVLLDDVGHLLDLRQPVVVLLGSVAHFIAGDIPELLRPLPLRLVPGSLLAISHAALDADHHPEQAAAVAGVESATSSGIHLRAPDEITAMFDGFPLVPPHSAQPPSASGRLVPITAWRPEPGNEADPPMTGLLAGVGIRQHEHDTGPVNPKPWPNRGGHHPSTPPPRSAARGIASRPVAATGRPMTPVAMSRVAS